jgi:electron transfer flavoprotein beta subunit
MNILVCISHVPDTTTKIQFDAEGKGLNKNGVSWVIGPFDEYALSRALEFKEKSGQGKIVALCVGDKDTEPTIRKALAVGADEGVRIDASSRDSFFIAKQIAEYAKGKGFDLIMTGKESIETNESAVGGMVAELLGLPFVSFCAQLDVNNGVATVTREIDGGEEILEGKLPLVISAQKGIAEWRIPNMRGIMAARTKPLAVVPAAAADTYTQGVKYETPLGRQAVKMLPADDVAPLVQVLADKGVI